MKENGRDREILFFGLPKFPDLDSYIGDRQARRDPGFPTVGNRPGTRKNAEDQMGEVKHVATLLAVKDPLRASIQPSRDPLAQPPTSYRRACLARYHADRTGLALALAPLPPGHTQRVPIGQKGQPDTYARSLR